MTGSDLELEAEMLTVHFNSLLLKWGSSKPLRTGLHASSVLAPAHEWCARQHVLAAVYPDRAERPEPKPWDAHQHAIFLQGWQLHEKWQMLFQKFGTCLEAETPHYDETRELWFTPDALYSFAGETFVVEIKGYKESEFNKYVEEPPEAAHLQANLYCHLLGIHKAIILLESKNDQNIKLWVIEHNPELARLYTHRMYDVKGATIMVKKHGNAKLPARVCGSPNDRLAVKCSMRKLCFSSEVE